MSATILRTHQTKSPTDIVPGPNVTNSINIGDQYFGSNQNLEHYFSLDPIFLKQYIGKKPNFGFNGLGECVYYRTYSRVMEDGRKETFVDTLKRVVEGCYEIQRRHCRRLHIPWTESKAQLSAQEMFKRMWEFKFLPPGRGLWMMGTKFMWERGSASLNNCAMVSTDDQVESDPAEPFCFMMDMAMLGVGVGFDTRGAGKIIVRKPNPNVDYKWYPIHDSREGWVDSVRRLIWSYTTVAADGEIQFDYSNIRPAGSVINGFGGKASGSGILIELHELIRAHLDRCVGKCLSSVDITDLMNYIGQCVVAGNVRRTAQVAFAEADDVDYRHMKNPLVGLSVEDIKQFREVTNKLYAAKRNKATLDDFIGTTIIKDRLIPAIETWNAMNHHRWASNNSIFAKVGMDYQWVGEAIATNGEPGLIWLDNVRDYGRMIDGRQPGIDGRVVGSNPCFAGNMRLLTAEGYVRLDDLWMGGGMREYSGLNDDPLERYGSQQIVNRNGLVPATNVYRTGSDVDLYRVIFSDKSHIDATANHQFIVFDLQSRRESRVKLNELQIGQLVPLNQTSHFGSTFHNPDYAELVGWHIGNGVLSPYEDASVVMPRLSGLLQKLHAKHAINSNNNVETLQEEKFVGEAIFNKLLSADLADNITRHQIPHSIWRGTRKTVAAFLRGLISADGASYSENDAVAIIVFQSSKELLDGCRLLLSQFGINSAVHNIDETCQMTTRKLHWSLVISDLKSVMKYADEIGFIQPYKTTKLRQLLGNKKNPVDIQYVTVKSVEYIGKGDTYCLTEPGNNQVVIEGYQVGQCLEQSLESRELCCLCETFPANHEDAADYMRTLKFAYLYAKTVTLLPTHNPRTNQVMLRNRRIGLSQSGIVQAFAKFGRRKVLSDFCDAGYNEVRRWDSIYAEWLCVQKSIKMTSVKPSGTVSLLVGCTPGLHYPEATTYWRTMRMAKDSILVKLLANAGYRMEPSVTDPKTMVVYFGISDESVPSVSKIPLFQQVSDVAAYQSYWADNQVSYTAKFSKSEIPQIKAVNEAFEDQIKGISYLPQEDHGYAQAPYQPCTPEEVRAYNASLKEVDYSEYIYEAMGSNYCDNDKCEVVRA